MADRDVVTFQDETVVIRIWISFHSHLGSRPDNTCLTKSVRWNWPVSPISRAICATLPWITAKREKLLSPCRMRGPSNPHCAPRICTSRENEANPISNAIKHCTLLSFKLRKRTCVCALPQHLTFQSWFMNYSLSHCQSVRVPACSFIWNFSMHSSNIIIHQSCFTDAEWDAL